MRAVVLFILPALAASQHLFGGGGGHKRDTHGCVSSAGFRWCDATKSCVRPWETKEPSCQVKSVVNSNLRHGGIISKGVIPGTEEKITDAVEKLRHGGVLSKGIIPGSEEKVAEELGSAVPAGAMPPSDMNGVFGMLPGILPVMLDETGKPAQPEGGKMDIAEPFLGGQGGIGPAWTYDESIEPPAGEKDMGGWTSAVYTEEQQARLGVDENGN